MKKILFLLAIVLLCGCSKSLEDTAKERAKMVIENKLKSKAKKDLATIEYLNFGEYKVVYSNDSVCVIDFDVKLKEFITNEKRYTAEYIVYKDFFESKDKGSDVLYEYGNINKHVYDTFLDLREQISGKNSSVSFYETLMGMFLIKSKFNIIE